jgi:predicted pyridoxine 5'-phosphate oxidase superfamily flavin-nucleotide-binding protein
MAGSRAVSRKTLKENEPRYTPAMGKQYDHISDTLQDFIKAQKIYFVATAARDGRVNVSPKGMDSFRILDKNKVAWLNLTGSGNETAAHLLDINRMTIMFCDFNDRPMILRLYGTADVTHTKDAAWLEKAALFPEMVGSRQVFEMTVDLVQTSCGFGVPLFDYVADRDNLTKWADNKGAEGVAAYWQEKNVKSIDGKPTGILQ